MTRPVDVAVVDEVQMVASPDRGWAWTRALLGLPAAELHLCGEKRSVDLLRRLCDLCDDSFECAKFCAARRIHQRIAVHSCLFVADVDKPSSSNISKIMPVREYQRLTPLAVSKTSLDSSLKNIEAGDCVVAFSRRQIHQLKVSTSSTHVLVDTCPWRRLWGRRSLVRGWRHWT